MSVSKKTPLHLDDAKLVDALEGELDKHAKEHLESCVQCQSKVQELELAEQISTDFFRMHETPESSLEMIRKAAKAQKQSAVEHTNTKPIESTRSPHWIEKIVSIVFQPKFALLALATIVVVRTLNTDQDTFMQSGEQEAPQENGNTKNSKLPNTLEAKRSNEETKKLSDVDLAVDLANEPQETPDGLFFANSNLTKGNREQKKQDKERTMQPSSRSKQNTPPNGHLESKSLRSDESPKGEMEESSFSLSGETTSNPLPAPSLERRQVLDSVSPQEGIGRQIIGREEIVRQESIQQEPSPPSAPRTRRSSTNANRGRSNLGLQKREALPQPAPTDDGYSEEINKIGASAAQSNAAKEQRNLEEEADNETSEETNKEPDSKLRDLNHLRRQGLSAYQKGDFQKAIQQLKAYHDRSGNEGDVQVYLALARSYRKRGRYSSATRYYQALLQSAAPRVSKGTLLLELADCQERIGNTSAAIQSLEKAKNYPESRQQAESKIHELRNSN
jgi:hypothetical protein